ncbi:MAG: TonB-dependent receptor [Pseudomonadales bacterium]|nr:TonB-dependent receptor [Pseudomonadales bacterium]
MDITTVRASRALSLMVASAGIASFGAVAQEPATQRVALEEIVVTAQKREESLQEAPISISVLSGDELLTRGIGNLKDLAAGAIPSVRFAPFYGRASAPALSMRGIQSGDVTQISRDPSFGIYIDGVYLGRVQGLGTEMLDVERMEVLRGPQGTLFGRNAVGGALNIVSRRPSGEFGIRQRVGLQNYDGRGIATHLDLPRMGNVAIKLDGLISERDGWVSNPLPGQWDYHQYKKNGFRIGALWEPTDRFDAYYSYDNSRDRNTSGYPVLGSELPNAFPRAALVELQDDRQTRARMGAPLDPSVAKAEGHGLNLSFSLTESIEIRSITAYRELSQTQRDQWAGASRRFVPNGAIGRYSLAEVNQDQFSQELQILGSSERFRYVAGLFYFKEEADDAAVAPFTMVYNADGSAVSLGPPVSFDNLGSQPGGRSSINEATSKAVFGQVTWTPNILADRLDITAGLRYTEDSKEGELLTPSSISYRYESDRMDPAVTLAYNWTDTINTYLRWGTAYRAGGANSRSATFRTFGDEEVETWEVGFKSELWDRRARVNLAAFYTDYTDLQFTFQNPENPSATETVNTNDKVVIKGIDADLTVLLLPELTANLNYAMILRDRPDQLNPFTGATVPTNAGFSPKHAASVSLDYDFRPFNQGLVTLHLDSNYSSGSYTASDERTSSYVLVNARATLGELKLGSLPGEFEVALWGRNLTDKEYDVFNYEVTGSSTTNGMIYWYGDPRTYGLELTFRY